MKKIIMTTLLSATLLWGCTPEVVEYKVDPSLVPEVTELDMVENGRAGDILTISGKKLDQVKEVRFGAQLLVVGEDFVSHSETDIEVTIPNEAPNGEVYVIALNDAVPNVLAGEITLRLPTATAVSPLRISAGMTITITGTDLDLTAGVSIGTTALTDVVIVSDTEITALCPEGISAGYLTITALNGEETTFEEPIVMTAVPTITMVTNAFVRGNAIIVGTNLNMVTEVKLLPSLSITEFVSQTPTMLEFAIPAEAITGDVTLFVISPDAPEGVESPTFNISYALPTITNIPKGYVGAELTITGTLLDYVTKVTFQPSIDVTEFVRQSATEIALIVPEGVTTGTVTLTLATLDLSGIESPEFTIEGDFNPTPWVFFDFDVKSSWWGDAGSVMPTDANSIDGAYFEIERAHDGGWCGLFWRNAGDGLNLTDVVVDSWAVAMEINVLAADAGMEVKLRLGDNWGIFR